MPQGRGMKDAQGRMILADDELLKHRKSQESKRELADSRAEAWDDLRYLTTWRDRQPDEIIRKSEERILRDGPDKLGNKGESAEEYRALWFKLYRQQQQRAMAEFQQQIMGILLNPQAQPSPQQDDLSGSSVLSRLLGQSSQPRR